MKKETFYKSLERFTMFQYGFVYNIADTKTLLSAVKPVTTNPIVQITNNCMGLVCHGMGYYVIQFRNWSFLCKMIYYADWFESKLFSDSYGNFNKVKFMIVLN